MHQSGNLVNFMRLKHWIRVDIKNCVYRGRQSFKLKIMYDCFRRYGQTWLNLKVFRSRHSFIFALYLRILFMINFIETASKFDVCSE